MSEDFQPIARDEAEANIKEFVYEHGLEGFLVLFFRQFLFRFIKQELQAADKDIEDASVQLHLDAEGDDALLNKRDQMRRECEGWARKLVEELKEDELVGEIIATDDFERLWDDEVEDRWKQQFHETLQDWKDEEMLDHAPPDFQGELPHDGSEEA